MIETPEFARLDNRETTSPSFFDLAARGRPAA
jgi:hypothetical protein